MNTLGHIFEKNLAWATAISEEDPTFFPQLAKQQTPEILWIGCADSRVPPNKITNLPPGNIFVHRNIANVVVHTDLNCLSVMQYAVQFLKVKHIIVCGHYGCGGVQASLDEDKEYGLIGNWLRHIKDVNRLHAAELDQIEDHGAKVSRLCELNVIEQVTNVCGSNIVKNAWDSGAELAVHGLIYDLGTGILKDLNTTYSSAADFKNRPQ